MKKNPVSPARKSAFQVLNDVFTQGHLLDEALLALDDLKLDPKDRALAREISSGTCRHWGTMRYVLQKFAENLEKFPPPLQRILELSCYQLFHLDRVPDYAVVSDAVELARANRMGGLSKAVNGILRTVIREREKIAYPKPENGFARYLSVTHSHPQWLVEHWTGLWDEEKTESLCRFNNQRAPISLRVRCGMETAQQWLQQQGVAFQQDVRFSNVLTIDPSVSVDPSWLNSDRWVVQDPVMTLAALAVAPQGDWRVWDVCAAPGGKTFHLADLMGEKGEVIAGDRSKKRLELLARQRETLSLKNVKPVVFDPLQDPEPLDFGMFDAILVDAPCTGWGTFRRNPDLRWRLNDKDSKSLADLSFRLLNETVKRLQPGGVLVYSTCTLSPVENQHVIRRFLDTHPSFQLDGLKPFLPDAAHDSVAPEGWFCGFPAAMQMDGAFIARMVKGK